MRKTFKIGKGVYGVENTGFTITKRAGNKAGKRKPCWMVKLNGVDMMGWPTKKECVEYINLRYA